MSIIIKLKNSDVQYTIEIILEWYYRVKLGVKKKYDKLVIMV